MAVLDTLPGIEVTIKSQGRTLPEYPDDSEWTDTRDHAPVAADKRISVYVECVSDATFNIVSSIKPPYKLANCQMLTFWAYVDGQAVGGTSSRHMKGDQWTDSMAASCARTGLNEVSRRAFKFARIQKVDDAESVRVKSDAKAVARIGEILVCVCRTRDEEGEYGWVANSLPVSAPGEVAEKALKGRALSHGVAFGEEQVERRTRIPKIANIDVDQYGNKKPLAIFRFKYRSRDALQQELIIPRSPSPDLVMDPLNALNTNAANNSQSRDERIANLKRELELIKSEAEVKEENPTQRGKKRRGTADDPEIITNGRAYKTSYKSDGSVVVDLTED